METQVTEFGKMPDGTPVELYTVWSGKTQASFTNFGARLVSLTAKDARGRLGEVVLGYQSLPMYLADKAFMGATIGRFGNRLAGGKFSVAGQQYQVPLNDGVNALHGGPEGFDQKIWTGTAIENGVEFSLTSPDGDMGFPGTLSVTVRYTFAAGVLRIEYMATCDAETVVNLTNHAYFNLAGEAGQDILAQVITIPADRYTPVDATLIPTGELAPVDGTPFDLRRPTAIGKAINDVHEQLQRAGGYDHNWVFGQAGTMKVVAEVFDPGSGRTLKVETTEPGLQFYAGNFLDGSMPNRVGGRYKYRSGMCLETQHYPDSPNWPEFPSTTLRAGETFRSETVYTFAVRPS